MPAGRIALAFAFSLTVLTSTSSAATPQSLGDASIAYGGAGSWTITAGGASLSVRCDPSQGYAVTALRSPLGTNWLRVTGADTIVTADGAPRVFGRRADGFVFASLTTGNDGHGLQFEAAFTLMPQRLLVTRHIKVVPGSPTFELWTSFQARGDPVSLSSLNAFQSVVAPGTVRWLTGHHPEPGDTTLDSTFARRQQTLTVGQTLTFGSIARSSEATVPWLAVDGAGEEFYGGLLWSGGWALTTTRTQDGLAIDWRLADMTTVVGAAAVEGPHAIVGVARGSLSDASAALRSYVIDGIRGGRPLTPRITYNTWFAYGTRIDESTVRREMARAAAIGIELFVIDAGWYTGADTHDTSDFEAGLGTWTADTKRFPGGLKALTDYAHSLGLKFGVWVEPERIDRSIAGSGGPDESSLATAGGGYQSPKTAMVCLAGEAGRRWVLNRLTALLDAAQPDYLKWDNNLWLNCDRGGHGHGASDGNFAHVTALYQMLDTLRQKYPQLVIENCSAGGNRMDFGMLRYTDAAWMDDRTAPSVHVRHNIDGLSLIFPPAYLLSFVTNFFPEPLRDAPDLSLYLRSRGEAVLGFSYQAASLSDDDFDAIAAELSLYKNLRPTLASGTAALLSLQANAQAGPGWDVLQVTAASGSALVYAFDNDDGADEVVVSPLALNPDIVYRVMSIDSGALGEMKGADLMELGIRIVRSPRTAAHVLSLIPQP